MNRLSFAAVLLAGAAGCAPARTAPATAATAATRAAGPTAEELRRDLYAFADDSMRGRETATPDAERAARFLAERLASLGVEPAGDSGFYARVPLQRDRFAADSRAQVTTAAGVTTLRLGADMTAIPALGGDLPLPALSADAEVVFAGYGLSDPALGRNDFAGLSVAGKVVVVVNDAPPGVTGAARERLTGGRGMSARLEQLIPRSPAAVVILLPDSLYEETAAQFNAPLTPAAETPRASGAARALPMFVLAPLRAGSPFVASGWPQNARPRALPRTRFTATLRTETEVVNAYNVVGVVRGADPALRSTYVAYGAHYDHVGIEPAVNGDSIANGADDDGSGSVALLALARSFQQGAKPRRSVLFVWHVGEEEGLWGSDRFVTHPTVPLDSVVAQLNADMIGRNAPDSLYLVGPAAAPRNQSRRLGEVVDSVNAASARPFLINREWDSPSHPEQIYYRSDHYNYAKRGVPIVFFTTGLHADYHKVSDEPKAIDYDKLARVSGFLYDVGTALANSADRPRAAGATSAPAVTP